MNVIFTCGGTAGHVNPALALASYMKGKQPDIRILFVGTPNGIEKNLVSKAGYDYEGIEISNLHRSIREISHNLHTLRTIITSEKKAKAIIDRFQPDLVVGTGGYASYPIVKCAGKHHIPTAVHESNYVPGLTTKLLQNYVDLIMVGFEDCKKNYRNTEKVQVTGTPARGEFFQLTKQQAKDVLGLTDNLPFVVSFWGSLGASTMNDMMIDFFREEKNHDYPFHHIHACGSKGYTTTRSQFDTLQIDESKAELKEYIYNMPVVMRAADLVISRAGASTISEITALGVPTILVPSPYVVNNHQEKNARVLERNGGAIVLTENELTGNKLFDTVYQTIQNPDKLRAMEKNMAKLGIPDALDRIYQACMNIIK